MVFGVGGALLAIDERWFGIWEVVVWKVVVGLWVRGLVDLLVVDVWKNGWVGVSSQRVFVGSGYSVGSWSRKLRVLCDYAKNLR